MSGPKTRPIIFSAPMVRAIMAGEKTQTRRVVTRQMCDVDTWMWDRADLSRAWGDPGLGGGAYLKAPWRADPEERVERIRCRIQIGDRLWVRETHAIVPASAYRCSREPDGGPVPHRVSPDGLDWSIYREGWTRGWPSRWRPSIHMPRWASRLTLEVTHVQVERVQSISEEDAVAEGVTRPWLVGHGEVDPTDEPAMLASASYREAFAVLWDGINGKRPGCAWVDDPWVWAVTFALMEETE